MVSLFLAAGLLAALSLAACSDDDGSKKPDATIKGDTALADTVRDTSAADGPISDGSADAAPKGPQTVSPQRASELINNGSPVVVDLREPSELPPTGIIAGAIKLPFTSGVFARDYASKLTDKGAEVILYCASGVRSSQAAQALDAAGYRQVYDIAGGMTAWKTAGLPTVAP